MSTRCYYDVKCTNLKCKFEHSVEVCPEFASCINTSCPLRHSSPLCKFGEMCTNGLNCNFRGHRQYSASASDAPTPIESMVMNATIISTSPTVACTMPRIIEDAMASMAPENIVAFGEMIATYGADAVASFLTQSVSHEEETLQDELTAEDIANMEEHEAEQEEDEATREFAIGMGIPLEDLRRMMTMSAEIEEAEKLMLCSSA